METKIRNIIEEYGGFMGIADLSNVKLELRRSHQKYFQQFTRGVVVGIPLIKSMTATLAYFKDPGMIHAFENHCLAQISPFLENLSLRIGLELQEQGYKSFVMFARGRPYDTPPYVLISNLMIGWLAGIGYVGKNGLLIHEKYGPRFRMNVVLTNAPLEPVGKPLNTKGLCAECSKCVQACPSKAITNEFFNPDNPSAKINNLDLCDAYRNQRVKDLGCRMCNLCQLMCPAGTL